MFIHTYVGTEDLGQEGKGMIREYVGQGGMGENERFDKEGIGNWVHREMGSWLSRVFVRVYVWYGEWILVATTSLWR